MSERFAILNPCQKRWSDLSGDGRKRFCDDRQTYVHALNQYSSKEFHDLRKESPGRICGLLTGESIPQRRSRRAVLVGALLTAVSPLMAQSGRVRIRVTDITGAVVPQAEASVLLGEYGYAASTVKATEAGEIIFTDLPIGELRLRVSSPGFSSLPMTVTVRNSDELRIEAKLEIGSIGETVLVEPVRDDPNRDARPLPVLDPSQPRAVLVPIPSATPVEVAKPPLPKRHWWHIFH